MPGSSHRRPRGIASYVLEGLVLDAAAGKRVTFIGRIDDAENAFKACSRILEDNPSVARISRANGKKHIKFTSGGRIDFRTGGTGKLDQHGGVAYIDTYYRDHEQLVTEVLARVDELILP